MKQQAIEMLVTIVGIVAAILLVVCILTVKHYLKLRSLRRNRRGRGFGREHFVDAFRPMGVPEMIPGAVFDYYTSTGVWKGFPLSPDDTYAQVLCDDPEDLDDDACELAKRLELRLPPEYVLREYGGKPLTTVREMVLWLNWIRQHQSSDS